jgi:regulation of enolase protein 1 (concanavalin A-like superfamily)
MNNIFNEMFWLHEPTWKLESGSLRVKTQHDSDFWQRTHYGFRRDNGHALLKPIHGNATIRARFQFKPNAQYDQCGILLRVDENNWFKCSTEYEDPSHTRLGSVLTRDGYSDWATQDISSDVTDIWYNVELKNSDITAKFSRDGKLFNQIRIAHLNIGSAKVFVGIYGCSPIGKGFEFCVSNLKITTI